MIDLGIKPSKPGSPIAASSIKEASKISYPSLNIGNEYGDSKQAYDIPLTHKDVGKTITATVKLKVTRIGEKSENGKENKYCAFDVEGIEFHGKEDGEEKRVGSAARHEKMTKELKGKY